MLYYQKNVFLKIFAVFSFTTNKMELFDHKKYIENDLIGYATQ